MSEAIRFTIPVFCVATMFAMGLDVTMAEISALLRNKLAMVIIVLVNSIVVPLIGFIIIALSTMLTGELFAALVKQIVPLTDGQQFGFLLLILAPGTLLASVLATMAGAKLPFAKGTMILLVGATAILLPFELMLVCQFPSMDCRNIDTVAVFTTLLIYQVLPLALGLLIKGRYSVIAAQVRPTIVQLSNLTLLIIVALTITSGQAVRAMPGAVPTVRTDEFSSEALASLENVVATLNKEKMPDGKVASEFTAHRATLPEKPAAKMITQDKKWMIVNAETTNVVRCELIDKMCSVVRVLTVDNKRIFSSSDAQVIKQRVAELNSQRISSALLDDFRQKTTRNLGFNLVVVLKEGQEWALVNAADTYFIEYGEPEFKVYRETAQPVEVLAAYLKSLTTLTSIESVIDLFAQFMTILLPYAMFIVLVTLLMTIGYYAGIAVRNVVGATGSDVPNTLAIATAVRNGSSALLIANALPTLSTATDEAALKAVTIVLVFYTVSLIAAAIQADRWSRQPETAPVAPASQPQAAVIAPERGATSMP